MERTRWYKDMCFYQIWPRSFKDGDGDGVGDLWGVYEKLDYIQSLHVDGIWFSPLYPSPNADYGYDVMDYMDISAEYGGMEAFKRVLEGAHKRGMKVIMDLVINHTSDQHPWFQASRRREEPYKDYYIWRKGGGRDGKAPNNWDSLFEGKAWQWDEVRRAYYLHLFAVRQPDLNMDNPLVRQEIKKILRFWLDLGVDGFREDVITFISKPKGLPNAFPLQPVYRGIFQYNHGPRIHEFLQEFRHEVLSKYDCMTLAEAPLVSPRRALEYIDESSGDIDMMIQFQCMCGDCFFSDYIPHPFFLPKLKYAWSRWQKKLEGRAWNCLYLENHDHPRVISRYGSERFRAESGKALAASYLFQKGTPFVYQGQELGMTNIRLGSIEEYEDVQTINQYRRSRQKDREKRLARIWRASRESARTPLQWDATDNAGFTTGTPWFPVNPNYPQVNAAQQEEDPDSLLNFYRAALKLRHELPLIRYGSYRDLRPLSTRLHVYERVGRGKRLLVICSYSDKPVNFTAPRGYELKKGKLLLQSHGSHLRGNGFTLRPYETRVYYFEERRARHEKKKAKEEEDFLF